MKLNLLYTTMFASAVLAFCACTEKNVVDYTVGEADNTIVLSAGLDESSASPMTKAGSALAGHYALKANTQIRLKVDGTWTGHVPESISQKTTCKALADAKNDGTSDYASTAADNINTLSFADAEKLFWDDYGTGDPANVANRTAGLDVYAVAVNGLTTAPAVADDKWNGNLAWSVSTDGTDVLNKDIICSNNLAAGGTPGKYTFANRNDNDKRRLEFKHVLSKITFNITAGAGFTDGKFSAAPEVILTRNLYGGSTNPEYCKTVGTINIQACSATHDGTVATVKAQQTNNVLTTVVEEAIVYPTSALGGSSDDDIIARINADGNIYYLKAEKIRAAMHTNDSGTDYTTKAGYNYVINVTIDKTQIHASATVTNWSEISSIETTPVINISAKYGATGTTPEFSSFSFYRSTAMNTGYGSASGLYYLADSQVTNSGSTCTLGTALYWPTHNTHYQFRAVYPQTSDSADPKVEAIDIGSVKYQVISVANAAYNSATFPSNLMIARPEVASVNCTNQEPGHTTTNLLEGGICATTGFINMNFRYMMSQVEVNLSSATGDAAVNLSGAVVEVVNVYNKGYIKLGSREAVTNGSRGSYTLDTVSGNKRHSAIVPQDLTYSDSGTKYLKFKVTVTNSDSTTDVYYADIEPIKDGSSQKIAPNGKWEAGVHYVYNLKLSKTAVNVTASITDWTTASANENVWF